MFAIFVIAHFWQTQGAADRDAVLDYETADKILSVSEHARIYVVPLFKLLEGTAEDSFLTPSAF